MSRALDAVLPQRPAVLAMLHLKGDDAGDRFHRALREIDVLRDGGVDAVIVENYFGEVDDMAAVLDHLDAAQSDLVVGLNVLGDDAHAFALAARHRVAFVQLDAVAGHLPPDEDEDFAARLASWRATSGAAVLGGVRFKYQPVRSGRSVEEDLALAVDRCDAVVVTGEGTGLVTPLGKIARFRRAVGPDFPLVVGAGVTVETAAAQLVDAQAVVVGSALKNTLVDTGDVDPEHVARFVGAVRALR